MIFGFGVVLGCFCWFCGAVLGCFGLDFVHWWFRYGWFWGAFSVLDFWVFAN